jgi:transposase
VNHLARIGALGAHDGAPGTVSVRGRLARDVVLGLLKTCRKFGLSFFTYLGGRLGLNGDQPKIPPLATLVIRSA